MIELAAEADIADDILAANPFLPPLSVAASAAELGAGPALGALWRRNLLRIGMTLTLSALLVYFLFLRLGEVDIAATWASVAQVAPMAWAGAAMCTALAFWAVGHYDAVLHRHFETEVAARHARMAGISAIAVSQTLGLGLVTGTVLRWRMMPDRSFWLASRITVAVALSFLAGWAVVTAAVLIVWGNDDYFGIGWAVIALASAGIAASVAAPRAPFRWPNLFTIGALLALCSVDVVAAASALFILLPNEVVLPFATLLPAFLLAYGAGLLSGAPGGIGAFELTLLALLPQVPVEPILVAVMGWRLIYFVLPAVLGAGIAIRGPQMARPTPRAQTAPAQNLPAAAATQVEGGHFIIPAELGLLNQGEHTLLGEGAARWMVSKRGHVLVGLIGACSLYSQAADCRAAIAMLQEMARGTARLPALYKVSAPMAAHARAMGWRVLCTAREAVISPASYDLSTPARAGLRRKLRRAESAGLTVTPMHAATLPWPELDDIAKAWSRVHGGERGFSMGRYTRTYVAGQRVYVAYLAGRPVAFATFHLGAQDWTLDLMRYGPDLPDGGMHALVHRAVMDAAKAGIEQFSLAAAPEIAFHGNAQAMPFALKCAKLGVKCLKLDNGDGLRRFKDAFAPKWHNRYLCAPNAAAMILAAASIARAIVLPRALPQITLRAEIAQPSHNRFALWAAIWHSRDNKSAN